MPVLLLLLLLLHTARAANTTTNSFTYSALGADVSAPRFVESNTTWQFDVSVSAAAGDLVFPLLPVPPAACAGGLVPLCCLYGLADGNRELGAYLHYLGPCEAHAGASSAAVLEDAPRPDALMKGMGQLRSWCPTPLACVFELDDTQFFNVTVAYTDDTRELALAVAFVRSLEGSPLVQLALARHTMRFDVRSNSMQFAFRDACEGMSKAPDALWRAGDACLWFCGPGFLLQPSAPSYFAMPPGAPNTCAAVPRPALLLEFELTVTTGWTPAALQLAAAAATGLLEQDTAYYQLPAGFSAVLFSRDCAANASALLATTTAALAGLAGVAVQSAQVTSFCPLPTEPFAVLWVAVGWACAGTLVLGAATCTACTRRRSSRRRLAERFAPLVAGGFSVSYTRLRSLDSTARHV